MPTINDNEITDAINLVKDTGYNMIGWISNWV